MEIEFSDWLSMLALGVSVIAIPISHRLGRRATKHDFINTKIDELVSILDKIYEHSISVVSNSKFSNEQYLYQVGLFLKLNWLASEINTLDKVNIDIRKTKLLSVKRIITDEVFHAKNKHECLNKLILVSSALKSTFTRRF